MRYLGYFVTSPKTYLVGRRYLIEKKDWGGDQRATLQSEESNKWTSHKIADQLSIGHATVERAAQLTLAIDKIIQVTQIQVNPKGFRD